ncbi:CARDB domain-containing protein [Candidatus Nanosalina sp. VS9-1]|uniref:CARDB domain-containing protein n=1 Tax=Candidatus Nanosalina sp. VS9-1 TaxID=3388566 RepID=UPI0039E00033
MVDKRKILLAFSVFLLLSGGAAELQGYVVESGPGEVQNLIYTWGSPDTTAYYQDAQAYPDVGLMLCDTSGSVPADYYVGLEYFMDGENQLVSYSSDQNLGLADTEVSFNGNTCKRTSIGGLTVSPSEISGTPETKIAAFPAEASMIVSESSDGSNPSFVDTGSSLSGSYSGNINYDYSSNSLNVDLDSITVNSDIGTRSFDPGASGRGISSSRPLIIGACSDSNGGSCNGLVKKKTSNSFPETFSFDISASEVNDQNVYTRYALANGKSFDQVSIGADLDVTGLSASRDPVYYSQNQTVSFSVRNTGNVPVTTDFYVEAQIKSNGEVFDTRVFTVTEDISPGNQEAFQYTWEASEESGSYSIEVEADTSNSVQEISENNVETRSFQLRPVTFPEIYVNGEKVDEKEVEFPDPGVPYNLTVVMENSDNSTLENSQIAITENDGMSAFAPSQEISDGSFTDVEKTMRFQTDGNGTASLTMSPTGNILLSERYDNTAVQDSIDYSINLRGSSNGNDLTFIVDGSLTDTYPLEVADPGRLDGEGTSELPNLDTHVKAVMNGVYTVFAEFWGAVT